MKKNRNLVLTAILLLLIGVMVGLILSMTGQVQFATEQAEVRVTEVQRSSEPLIKPENLENLDARFLFQTVAREVIPTVVYIETMVSVRDRSVREEESEGGLWERLIPRRAQTVGSGVIITPDGYILTNNHVVEGAVNNGINIVLHDRRTYAGKIVGTDPSTDLAVIKVDAEALPSAVMGNSDSIEIGEWVLAIGNPFRLQSTVTAGIVSALSRNVQIINDRMSIESFIQTDAAINRGNSGGALINTSGELIGVNTAIATQSGNYQGYGFAIPSNLALKVARDIIEFGEVRRGMLGISIESVSDVVSSELGMDQIRGVLIATVTRDGAAYESGLQTGDVILEVDGAVVNQANQLQERVAMNRPGDIVKLTIWRDGEVLQIDVTLREMEIPEQTAMEFDEEPIDPDGFFEEEFRGMETHRFELGFSIRALAKPEDPRKYDLIVSSVRRDSEAWSRGLREDDEIVEVDGKPVETLSSLQEWMAKSLSDDGSVMLSVVSVDSGRGYIELKNR